MKKVLAIVAALALTGCNLGTTHIIPQNFQEVDISKATKHNSACDIMIPFLLIQGPSGKEDSSIITIAKQSDIKNITYVDYTESGIMPIFKKRCYNVYGY